LRHQLQVLNRSRPRRLRLVTADRWLWAWLSRSWPAWRTALVIVKPETVVGWHRQGFRVFWTWKSRRRVGRPTVAADVCALIRTMSEANPLWGAPRIHGELLKLDFDVSQATVAKYMLRRIRPPSQTWRTFLTNHVQQIAAADFFVVPTTNDARRRTRSPSSASELHLAARRRVPSTVDVCGLAVDRRSLASACDANVEYSMSQHAGSGSD